MNDVRIVLGDDVLGRTVRVTLWCGDQALDIDDVALMRETARTKLAARYGEILAPHLEKLGMSKDALAAWLKPELLAMTAKLDEAKKAALAKRTDGSQNAEGFLSETTPWPSPMNGAAVLDAAEALLRRFIVFSDANDAPTVALWCLHTFTVDAFAISPRLQVTSAERECGKSTLLDLVRALSARAFRASSVSEAALFRLIETHHPTILLDECDHFVKDRPDVIGILNDGFMRGGTVLRCEKDGNDKQSVKAFRVFGAVALGGIGRLKNTLESRSIRVSLRRKTQDERVAHLRPDRIDAECLAVRQQFQRWANDHIETLREMDVELPSSLHNRAGDLWRPLLTLAELIGSPWAERTRAIAEAYAQRGVDQGESLGALLLADIRDIFAELKTERLLSRVVVDALVQLEHRPWAEWGNSARPITPNQLAALLKPYDVRPGSLRTEPGRGRGYELQDFAEAFKRFLPSSPAFSSRDAVTALEPSGLQPLLSRDTSRACHGPESPASPTTTLVVTVSRTKTPPEGPVEVTQREVSKYTGRFPDGYAPSLPTSQLSSEERDALLGELLPTSEVAQ